MGTTRMHNDPEQGVVDPNLKVHSLNNLYVAGASVFPSGGGLGAQTRAFSDFSVQSLCSLCSLCLCGGSPANCQLWLHRGEFFGHSDEIGEGVGVHFFHYLAAVEFDGDFARA